MQNAMRNALIMNIKLKMYFTKRLDYLFRFTFYLNFWKDFRPISIKTYFDFRNVYLKKKIPMAWYDSLEWFDNLTYKFIKNKTHRY